MADIARLFRTVSAEVRLLSFAAACSLQACGGLGDTYVVHVDPRFTQDEQAQIVAALDSWEAAVPVHFTVEIGPCSGVHGGMICTHASSRAEIAAKQAVSDGIGVGLTLRTQISGNSVDGGEVFIDQPTVEANYASDFQRIVAHEIGHAMQLEHDGPGHLMAAMVSDDAPAPTCADDAQWYELRGKHVPTCPASPPSSPH